MGRMMETSEPQEFRLWDAVEKRGGDYKFFGIVVSKVHKLDGKIRYVVENPDGVLHIFSGTQLVLINRPGAQDEK